MNTIPKMDEAVRRTVDMLIEKDYLDRSKFGEIKDFSENLKTKVYGILAQPPNGDNKQNGSGFSEPLIIPIQKVVENNSVNYGLGFMVNRLYHTLDLVNLQVSCGRNLYKVFQDLDIYRLPTAAKAYESLKQSKVSLSNKTREIIEKQGGKSSSLKR